MHSHEGTWLSPSTLRMICLLMSIRVLILQADAKVETPASAVAAGQQQMPIAAGLTDGLLLLETGAVALDTAADGPLQNVKRWMQELHFPENVSPSRASRPALWHTKHVETVLAAGADAASWVIISKLGQSSPPYAMHLALSWQVAPWW